MKKLKNGPSEDDLSQSTHSATKWSPQPVNLGWDLFENVGTLGTGAFGDVYKVKCLQSSHITENGRQTMSSLQIKKAKNENITAISNNGGQIQIDKSKTLIKDQFYVIKVIDVAIVPQEVGIEALKEIETMQSLDSPYVIGYYDSFIEDQKINIILQFCPYGDLNSLIQKQNHSGKAFNENVIWKIFINICLGVCYLHQNGIIHRDIKTLNIFMVKDSIAKVGDLGCAIHESSQKSPKKDKMLDVEANDEFKLSESMLIQSFLESKDLTQSLQQLKSINKPEENNRVGTPFYLAPELWRDEPCTKKSDIWALGVILYELCCHAYPFPATEEEELKQKVLTQKMEKIPHNVNLEFVDFINKMLKKDANERPCIEEIIYNDVFQNKAQLQKVSLPLILNKQKLIQKNKLNQLKFDDLTPFQRKMIGMKKEPEQPLLSKKPSEKLEVVKQEVPEVQAIPKGNKFQPKTIIKGGNKNADSEDKTKVIRKEESKGMLKPPATARDRKSDKLSPRNPGIINLKKKPSVQIPVEKIKLGGKIKQESAMDLENDDGAPQVQDMTCEEEKKIDKKKIIMEKTKKLQLKLEANNSDPFTQEKRSSKLSQLREQKQPGAVVNKKEYLSSRVASSSNRSVSGGPIKTVKTPQRSSNNPIQYGRFENNQMTNPRASKAEDSSEAVKKGFFKKILNKVASKKPIATNHKTSLSISSNKSVSSMKKLTLEKKLPSIKAPLTARNAPSRSNSRRDSRIGTGVTGVKTSLGTAQVRKSMGVIVPPSNLKEPPKKSFALYRQEKQNKPTTDSENESPLVESIQLQSKIRAPVKFEDIGSPLIGQSDETQKLEQKLLDEELDAKINHQSPIKLLQDSNSTNSPEAELGISLRDHILEEVKGRDSPIKRVSNKFSPSKSKYVSSKPNKIGDSSDSDDAGGFKLQAID